MEEKTIKEPVGGYRFQVIGLVRNNRNTFLSNAKLNNKSGSEVIKTFMEAYNADSGATQEAIENIIASNDRSSE